MYSFSKIIPVFAVVGILAPLVSVLPDRDFGAEISSSTIIFAQSRYMGAVISSLVFGVIVFLGLILSRGRIRKGVSHPELGIIVYLVWMLVSLFVGLVEENQFKYIVSSCYTMGFWTLAYYVGKVVGRSEIYLLRTYWFLIIAGMSVLFYEMAIAILSGSILPIRYGSGIGIPLAIIGSTVCILFGRKFLLFVLLVTSGIYVLASVSRSSVVIYCLSILTVFFLCVRYGERKRRGEVLRTLFPLMFIPIGILLLVIWMTQYSVLGFSGLGLLEALQYRFSNTVGGGLDRLWSVNSFSELYDVVDASTRGRFIEVEAVIGSLNNYLIGNGLGGSYFNIPNEFDTDYVLLHYIHITPVLIIYRQGVIGIFALLFAGYSFYRFCRLQIRQKSDLLSKVALICFVVLSLMAVIMSVSSSGVFYRLITIAAFFGGLMAAYRPAFGTDVKLVRERKAMCFIGGNNEGIRVVRSG